MKGLASDQVGDGRFVAVPACTSPGIPCGIKSLELILLWVELIGMGCWVISSNLHINATSRPPSFPAQSESRGVRRLPGSFGVAEGAAGGLRPGAPQLCGNCWEMLPSTNAFALHLPLLVAAKVPYSFLSQVDTDVLVWLAQEGSALSDKEMLGTLLLTASMQFLICSPDELSAVLSYK